jgi:hypothetical protein
MRRFPLILSVLLANLLFFGLGRVTARQAPAAAATLATTFTYQGRLMDGANPANGPYALVFRLFTAETGGQQIGAALNQTVTVSQGLFTAQLDFGTVAFGAAPRWLEIQVANTVLTPRQLLTAAPLALYAQNAAAATTAVTASAALAAPWNGLTGVPADLADGDDVGLTSVSWGDIQTRPAGLDDGDDDTTYTAGSGLTLSGTQFGVDSAAVQSRVTDSCPSGSGIQAIAASGTVTCEADDNTTYTAGTGLTLSGTQFRAQGSPISNTLIVAKGGGDFTSVQAALNSITTASATNPYLIVVASGLYTEQVTLKSYVTLEGAGEGSTILRWTGGTSSNTASNATLVVASNTTVRHMTIESATSGSGYAVGIYTSGSAIRLSNLTVTATGGTLSFGVYPNASAATLTTVTVTASGATGINTGIYNNGATQDLTHATITATGGSSAYALSNVGGTSTLTSVTITASGASGANYAIYNTASGAALTMSQVTARASGGTSSAGLYVTAGSPLVRDSSLTGTTNSVYRSGSGLPSIATSLLSGPVSSGVICFNNYTATFGALRP